MEAQTLLNMFSRSLRPLWSSTHCQKRLLTPPKSHLTLKPVIPTLQARNFRTSIQVFQGNQPYPNSRPPERTQLVGQILDDFDKAAQKNKGQQLSFNQQRRATPMESNYGSKNNVQAHPNLDLTIPMEFDIELPPVPKLRPPELGPNVGRSVPVTRGDIGLALTKLNRVLKVNNVKVDVINQKFHERAGLKRKRLKRERHRKRFKEGFRRMVGIVLQMKKQGL